MAAIDFDALIRGFEAEEAELQFDRLSNEDAIGLGLALLAAARIRGAALTVDVRRGGQQLFHAALPGTSADNDQWVLRKSRVAERFGKSSLHVGTRLARDGLRIEEKYCVDPREYSAHGGSFPLILRGTGPVGSVTVSGLPQAEDHALLVAVLRDFLADGRRG